MSDPMRIIRTPDAGRHKLSLLDDIYVEKGSNEDWKLLHELHYKSSALGIGPRYWRAVLDDGLSPAQTIGILVMTVPKPLDGARNMVFPHLKPNAGGHDNRLVNRMRMVWMNNNLILSSRTVVDTMYRGAGIAYRLKNLGHRMCGKRFVEARSSMSRFNPFYAKAGMSYVQPKHSASMEEGLLFFSRNFESPPFDIVALLEELKNMRPAVRERVLENARKWYYDHSSMEKSGDNRMRGMTRIDAMDPSHLLRQILQLTFGASIYGIWQSPDGQVDKKTGMWIPTPMPDRLPMSAFDLQGPTEPLRLDLLKKV